MEEITIFTTYDSFEADRIRAALESEKIPSYKRSHGAGDYLGVYFGRTNINEIEIVIPAEAEEKASAVLEGMGYTRGDEEPEA